MGEFFERLVATLVTVAIAVGVSGGIWVGANLVANQIKRDWGRFALLAYGACGLLGGVLLSGNRLTRYSGGNGDGALVAFGYWVWLPLVLAIGAAMVGWMLARARTTATRIVVGAGGLGAVGAIAGALMRAPWRPEVEIGPLVGWTAAVAAIGAAVGAARRRPPVGGAFVGAAVGWVLGAWGAPDLGGGSAGWAVVAAALAPAFVGVRLAIGAAPTDGRRSIIDQRARAAVFVAPALLFIFGALVVPALRTLYLSFLDRKSDEYVGVDNYEAVFRDPKSWDTELWSEVFTSRLFWIGVVLLAGFVVLGLIERARSGKVVEFGSASMGPLIVGGLLLAFAVATTTRGTIVNNLWWVVVVTVFSTTVGLAIAVLADGARFEKVAKSVIFMPMAISMVGASVIWRFMYVARDASKEQTGVMNGLWVGLGRLSTGVGVASTVIVALLIVTTAAIVIREVSTRQFARAGVALVAGVVAIVVISWVWNELSGDAQRVVAGVVLSLVFVALVVLVVRAVTSRVFGRSVAPAVGAVVLGWFLIRYWQITGGGVGGQRLNSGGRQVGDPINFIQDPPFNNMWLMVVLIWIQTGFAMVILSAAIKAVPTELLEAARVDGATTPQVFWRVTLPQIGTTIGVVVTTLMVLVMKVYDIVQVLTNGNFGTEVLANNMYRETFVNGDYGLGSALAILIFVSVLPVIYLNIRRMQKEA